MYEMRMTINIDMFIINKKINWKSKQKAPVQVVDQLIGKIQMKQSTATRILIPLEINEIEQEVDFINFANVQNYQFVDLG